MILYEFDYERPANIEAATAKLRALGLGARIAAGGTDLLPSMRAELVRPSTVVSLGAIVPAPPVRQPDGAIRIDALTRLATLENAELIRSELPMLAQAAGCVAGNQIRQMGTIGGNLCQETRCLYLNQKHDYQFKAPCYKRGGDLCYPFPTNAPGICWSVYMSDTAPALISLGAEVEVVTRTGVRQTPVESLFTGNGLSPINLSSDEIIRAIVVPPRPARFGWGYCKSARRGGLEFGISVMAVSLVSSEDRRTCSSARIVIGAVRERPVRLVETERSIEGAPFDEKTAVEMAAAAAKEINPLPHHGFAKSYIRDDLRIKIRRVIEAAFARALGEAND